MGLHRDANGNLLDSRERSLKSMVAISLNTEGKYVDSRGRQLPRPSDYDSRGNTAQKVSCRYHLMHVVMNMPWGSLCFLVQALEPAASLSGLAVGLIAAGMICVVAAIFAAVMVIRRHKRGTTTEATSDGVTDGV